MIRHLRLLEARRLASDGNGACGLGEVAVGEQSFYCIKKYRHYGPKALRTLCLLSAGSFFIAYILMLLGIGIPLLFLEMAVGQRSQQGSVELWKNLSPWFGGVGYSMVMVRNPRLHKPAPQLLPSPLYGGNAMTDCPGVDHAPSAPPSLVNPFSLPDLQVCFISNTYLNVFNAWILFYMSHIFHFVAPWEKCPLQKNSSDFGEEGEWRNEGTWEEEERKTGRQQREAGKWGVAASSRPVQSCVSPDPECEQATSYTYFWYRQTLKASDRFEDGGQPSFSLGMFLFLAWCLICVFVVNGIKSIGKVSRTGPQHSQVLQLCLSSWTVIPESFLPG